MKIIKTFKNNELLTFTKNNKIKIYIDDNYDTFNIKKGYKMNLIPCNKGSYKGSFMNNYICKKFISNQKVNLTNIETNKILSSCRYFLLSQKEYINSFCKKNKYQYCWFLRSPGGLYITRFCCVDADGTNSHIFAYWSYGFVPFFFTSKKIKK